MSMNRIPRSFSRPCRNPQLAAQLLGEIIESARKLDDRPIERLAPSAGLDVADWLDIEAGHGADYAWGNFLLMATVLGRGPRWVAYVGKFYLGARQQQ